MANIDFNTLFTRLGHNAHVGYVLAGNQAAVPAVLTTLFADYEGTTDLDLIGTYVTQETSLPSQVVSLATTLAPLASSTLLRMVQASVPSVRTVQGALAELIRQMKANAESVKTCAVTAAAAALTTNVGAGAVVTSTKRGDGLVQENLIAEVLRLSCSADSFTGGATLGREPFSLLGAPNSAGLWDYNYPQGSGASANLNAVSADQDASASGNLLTNGDMETWDTTGTPFLKNFTMSGTWGTDMQRSTTAYRGTYSLQIDSGTTANIYQGFADGTNGTAASPSAYNSYAVNFFARAVAGTVTGGVLTVELVDGTGTVINDGQSVANSFTLTLSTLTTSWVAVNGVFRLPEEPPATVRLRLRVSSALTGDDVLVDDLCFAPLTAPYPGSFGLAVFSGATAFVVGDGYNVTATNDRGGNSYLATFQAEFDRWFNMRQLGLLLPSSGTPTQADTKITA